MSAVIISMLISAVMGTTRLGLSYNVGHHVSPTDQQVVFSVISIQSFLSSASQALRDEASLFQVLSGLAWAVFISHCRWFRYTVPMSILLPLSHVQATLIGGLFREMLR